MAERLNNAVPMQEVALPQNEEAPANPEAVGNLTDDLGSGPTTSGKTNSLRRFFKLPLSKAERRELRAGSADEAEDTDGSSGTVRTKNKSRFGLRLGTTLKSFAESDKEKEGSDKNLKDDIRASSSTATVSCPKTGTLRGSISTYWNTVFKRNRSTKDPESPSKDEAGPPLQEPLTVAELTKDLDMDDGFEQEVNFQKEIRDEIHSLPKSKDLPKEDAPNPAPRTY